MRRATLGSHARIVISCAKMRHAAVDGSGSRPRLVPSPVVAFLRGQTTAMSEHDAFGPSLRRQRVRSEEHTSELQSHSDLVCRLLLEKKKKKQNQNKYNTST